MRSRASVRAKVWAAFLIWLGVGALLLLGALYVHQGFVLALVFLQLVVGLYVMLLRCPRCKKPVLQNSIGVLGREVFIWTPWVPRCCTRCGEPLR